MDEKTYHTIADATLSHCYDQLDLGFEAGSIEELELQGGILTIYMESGRTYLVTKHAPSMQVWYASPISGGLHFSFDSATKSWRLPDGRNLYDMLANEMRAEGVEVTL